MLQWQKTEKIPKSTRKIEKADASETMAKLLLVDEPLFLGNKSIYRLQLCQNGVGCGAWGCGLAETGAGARPRAMVRAHRRAPHAHRELGAPGAEPEHAARVERVSSRGGRRRAFALAQSKLVKPKF